MESANFIGQTLDHKYKIERELGRGGMGTVYLATHVGTERPVALKIIAPQFMERLEFVERFRREARAAGRLRHPNVVNVTDFGFAETPKGNVAYLVMEYLDGVTLGEILEEEKRIPLSWTIDILEQVCFAVQEAHEQGIIHRDLKPDNIWLEPNQRGGYTVKVLDFGIAKLEENVPAEAAKQALVNSSTTPTRHQGQSTIADATQPNTIIENRSSTIISEAATVAQTKGISNLDTEAGTMLQSNGAESEDKTAILPAGENKTVAMDENAGTRLISEQFQMDKTALKSPSTSELTRVGAVLGTPLYMSPEQCRGERLSQSSDIYSLGVIAYQMLSGETPFKGDFNTVMNSHKETEPPKLEVKKVPKKVRQTIFSALSKNIDERPASAQAFSSKMRSYSEGVGSLLQRSLVLYGENLPTLLWLTFLMTLPTVLLTVAGITVRFLAVAEYIPSWLGTTFSVILSLILFFTSVFFGSLLIGMITWLVIQKFSAPLRPVNWKPAFRIAKSKWKRFAGTITISSTLSFLALLILTSLGAVPAMIYGALVSKEDVGFFLILLVGLMVGLFFGFDLTVRFGLVSPIVMMEDVRGFAALRRSNQLVKRSHLTAFVTMVIYFMLPLLLSGLIASAAGSMVNTGEAKSKEKAKPSVNFNLGNPDDSINLTNNANDAETKASDTTGDAENKEDVKVGTSVDKEQKHALTLFATLKEALFQILWIPINIIFSSFSSVTFALLYLKTRLSGGESWEDLLQQFETDERPKSKWQERVRERLIQSGRVTSKS